MVMKKLDIKFVYVSDDLNPKNRRFSHLATDEMASESFLFKLTSPIRCQFKSFLTQKVISIHAL